MEKIKTVEEFCERIKKKENVSRFDFELGFKWTAEASAKLKAVIAYLSSANLSSANLSYANLSSADLRSANLSYANLSSADLSYANLRSANLSSADLSYADLSSADLSSADLSSAKGTFIFNFGVKLRVVNEKEEFSKSEGVKE